MTKLIAGVKCKSYEESSQSLRLTATDHKCARISLHSAVYTHVKIKKKNEEFVKILRDSKR